ncbi:MAG: glutamate racemase [Candidatus Nomurabacteria bacterium]|jgi:glutamate racemase|nr:glutamate racemase [Candidatus Nomurabacteria bacterium]
MKIGVFDSGVGGRNILAVLQKALPEHAFAYACDAWNVPYGNKSPEQVIELTMAAIKPLVKDCGLIVVACNTATSYAIEALRNAYPTINFVGLEPAIKPAAQLTRSGVITVCATPATLISPNYKHLKHEYARKLKVIEPDCSDWAGLIESGQSDQIKLDTLASSLQARHCDVLVLGCTHYHALQAKLQELLPNTKVIDPSDAVAEQVKRYL